jgi:hypothetical protein
LRDRGIRYTLRLEIERQKWVIGVHPTTPSRLKGIHPDAMKAEQLARSMIDAYRRPRNAQAAAPATSDA